MIGVTSVAFSLFVKAVVAATDAWVPSVSVASFRTEFTIDSPVRVRFPPMTFSLIVSGPEIEPL